MDGPFILDALKALEWPLAILAVLGMFRGPLTRLLDRGTRLAAGPTGLAIEATARAEQIEASTQSKPPALPAPSTQAGPQALRSPEPNPVCDPFDAELRKSLDDAFGDRSDLKLDWAIRVRSHALVERTHETTYRVIFTSQILALKRLNELGGRSTLSKGREAYDAAAKQNPSFYQHVTWDGWVAFMRSTGHVEIGSEADPVVRLTPLGKDFLVWMTFRGLPDIKQF
jgi:hypothetical protein